MKNVLIVYYSLGGNTKLAAETVAEGVIKAGDQPILKTGLEATLNDLINCDGLIIGCPDYFSHMAGGLKDFFDRTYHPSKGKVDGKPYAAFICCDRGGIAIVSIVKMCRSFKLVKIARPLFVYKTPDQKAIGELIDFGFRFSTILNSPGINKIKIKRGNKILNKIIGKIKKLHSMLYRF